MMLCYFCKDLDLDQTGQICSKGAVHHASLTDLMASAEEGCELCMLIRDRSQKGNLTDQIDQNKCIRYLFCDRTSHSILYFVQGNGLFPNVHARLNVCTTEGTSSSSSGLEELYRILILKFELDDTAAKEIPQRPMYHDVSSIAFFEDVARWITICETNHSECLGREEKLLPTRVIDVGDEKHDPFLSISNGRHGSWITLSHCWGGTQPVKTELSTLHDRSMKLPLEELPPLFKDAVIVTRNLGYRYLWIDSLCIIQDSTDDWIRESANMGYVYSNCVLTIAAEASPNSTFGLFQSPNEGRKPDLSRLVRTRCHSSEKCLQGQLFCDSRADISAMDSRGPLSRRCWALQENVLAPRILRFAKQQVWWQCRGAQWNERWPSPHQYGSNAWNIDLPLQINQGLLKSADKACFNNETFEHLGLWYRLVNDYSARMITFETDKLPAISGVAKAAQRSIQQEYKAGLWLNDIIEGLLWSSSGPGAVKAVEYVAPSWSWASINFSSMAARQYYPGTIYFNGYGNSRLKSNNTLSKVIAISVSNVGNDPFAQVVDGSLRIQGPCQTICSCMVPRFFFDCHESHPDANEHGGRYYIDMKTTLMSTHCDGDNINVSCRELTYLYLLSLEERDSPRTEIGALGLILERTGPGKFDTYQRVGRVRLQSPGAVRGRTAKTSPKETPKVLANTTAGLPIRIVTIL
jgi:hypothetical protein